MECGNNCKCTETKKVLEVLKNNFVLEDGGSSESGKHAIIIRDKDNQLNFFITKTISEEEFDVLKSFINRNDDEDKESYWEIAWDGYYPYCYNCKYEPSYKQVDESGLSEICPRCGSRMTNAKDLNSGLKLKK